MRAPDPNDAFTIEVRTVLEGQFFRGSPGDRLHQNIIEMVRGITQMGVREVQSNTPRRSGKLADSMYGELKRMQVRGLTGVTTVSGFGRSRLSNDRPNSYVTWIERGVRRRPGGGSDIRGKGRGMFRKTRTKLARFKPEIAEILKGVD